jgi:hypothetical protein
MVDRNASKRYARARWYRRPKLKLTDGDAVRCRLRFTCPRARRMLRRRVVPASLEKHFALVFPM